MALRKILGILTICTLCCGLIAQAQEEKEKEDNQKLINELTFALGMDGVVLNFVLLNDKTVDVLFQGSSKLAMRTRANQTTIFYVHGTTSKKIDFNPDFKIVQNSQYINTKAVNIKNFQIASLEKNTRIEGLMQLVRKINLFQPFKLIDSKEKKFPEFQFSDKAIELMGI